VRPTIGCGPRSARRLCDVDNSAVVATTFEAMREVARWRPEVVMAIWIVDSGFGGGRRLGCCHVTRRYVRIRSRVLAKMETRRRAGGQNFQWDVYKLAKSDRISSHSILGLLVKFS